MITVHYMCWPLQGIGNKLYILLLKCYSINFTSFFNTSFNGLNWSGSILIFIVPSAPHEKMWFAGPVSICITPVPIFLKMDCRACSLIKVWRRLKVERLQIWNYIKDKIKIGVDKYLKIPSKIKEKIQAKDLGLSLRTNKEFLKQKWRKICVGRQLQHFDSCIQCCNFLNLIDIITFFKS